MAHFAQYYRGLIDQQPSNLSGWTFYLLLWPWAQLYRAVIRLRADLYRLGLKRAYQAGVPVVSVGNLTVGGTGKTPVVDALVKRLLARGVRVAVVSRGYGGQYRGESACVARGDGQLLLAAAQAGDEPCLLAQLNPGLSVYVARQRALGVQAAERDGAQVIVLDDGFQHLAVQRDLDIVLLDARSPFGNGQLLPAGPLRESPQALQRAGLVVLTHAAHATPHIPFHGPIVSCRHRLGPALQSLEGTSVPWTDLTGKSLLAFAGIARPEDFFAALCERGVTLRATLAFDDHQDYCGERLNQLIDSCQNIEFLVTTGKDAVKLDAATLPCPCLVAPLELEFDNGDELDRVLEKVVGERKRP